MSDEADEIERLHAHICMLEDARSLIVEVDNHDLRERSARTLRMLIHLSHGNGESGVYIKKQRQLAELIGIAETHIRAELDFLVEANMLRISSERDYYEVNSDKASWKAGPRCKLGFDRACALTEEILDGDFCRRDTQTAFAQTEGNCEGDRVFEESFAENSEEHPVHAEETSQANIGEKSQALSPLRVMFNALRRGWPPGIPSELIRPYSP